MRLKQLATAAICVTALGGAVGVAPAAAKPDKVKQCHQRGHHEFSCDTAAGDTVTSACPSGYEAEPSLNVPGIDLNGNYVICVSNSLPAVDDTPVQ
ncbi:MAG: hypothetical protein QOD53_794 [Thermoleophilaceae bacterium]|jgi:hypothetical protein|nr:hypothetical protein [Thermoleophilaceae bacterium]